MQVTQLNCTQLITFLFGQVKGRPPPGCPRYGLNDFAVHDCRLRRIPKPYKNAQNRLLYRDKTCLART